MALKLICSPCSIGPITTVQESLQTLYGQSCQIMYLPLTGDDLIHQVDSLGDEETWGVWISMYDLADIEHFITTLLGLAYTKKLSKLVVALPQATGDCLIHHQLREVIAHLQRAECDTVVLECPLLFSEILLNQNLLETERILILPTDGATMAWINPEEVARQFAYHLLYTQISMTIRLAGRVYLSGRTIASSLTGLLAHQEGVEAWAKKRLECMDTRADERLDREELRKFFQQLDWFQEEIEAWIDQILGGKRSIGFEKALEDLRPLLPAKWNENPEPYLYLHLTPEHSLQEWESSGELEEVALQKGIEYWEGNTRYGESMEDSYSLGELEKWLDKQFLQLQVMQILPGLGVLSIQYSLGPNQVQPIQILTLSSGITLTRTLDRSQNLLSYSQRMEELGSTSDSIWVYSEEKGRSMQLEGNIPVSISSTPNWEGWKRVFSLLQQQESLPNWQIKLFRTLGELELSPVSPGENPTEELCKCVGLTRAECIACIAGGAQTVEEIAAQTQATQTCGGCYPLIEEVLAGNTLELAEVLEKEVLNENLIQVRIKPVNKEILGAEAGQHILVQGRLDNEWVSRPYTLTAASSFYEFVVKREAEGKMSNWLSEKLNPDLLLRITEPRGNFTLSHSRGKVFFFAGGIGVTPALAMIRSQGHKEYPRPFHLDWSVRATNDMVFEKELRYWEHRLKSFTWTHRISSQTGRVSSSEIAQLYPFQEEGAAYICGPEGYVNVVYKGLLEAGWPESLVKRELFSALPKSDTVPPISEPVVEPEPVPEIQAEPTDQNKPYFPEDEESEFEKHREEEKEWEGKPTSSKFSLQPLSLKEAYQEAEAYMKLYFEETQNPGAFNQRWKAVEQAFFQDGTYQQTFEELQYGARVAWRNSTRCIGRYFWDKLMVRDLRHINDPEDMFQALVEHLRIATNGGNILPVISVFNPHLGYRLWNPQLIQYAGYRQTDGSVLGDPANVELTERIMELGWPGGDMTPFDVLPLVIERGSYGAQWFEIPEQEVLQVPISHPRFPWFEDLGLKWYAVPAVSNMALDLGGIQYPFIPFNGFYMGTEIGARNLSDANRYNMLPEIARRMGLDTEYSYTLWKDAALLELNIAVLHSFKSSGVRMMDHHSLSEFFLKFDKDESACQREVHADWTWLVPPISGSSVEIFHQDKWENTVLKPNYFYMDKAWESLSDSPNPQLPKSSFQDVEGTELAKCPFHQQLNLG